MRKENQPVNVRKVPFFPVFLGLAAVAFAQEPSSPAPTSTLFDATRLRTGEFHYQVVKEGKEISGSVLTIEKRADASFRFTAKFDGFNQQWLSIATRAFAPITAQLRMGRANGDKYTMDLVYDKRRVTAAVSRWKPEAGSAPPNKEFTAEVMSGTVDQRVDWAAVLSSPLQEGQKFGFTVYDAEAGVSHVTANVSGEEEIHTPAGTFKSIRASYRIEKSSGAETYAIFASKDFPRFLVREDFQNGESLQLTEIRNGHD